MVKKEVVRSGGAAELGLPLSQAVRVGNLVWTYGAVPVDPGSGEVVRGDIREQTRVVLENLKAVLEDAGSSLDNVIKATVYLSDMKDYEGMNEVYREYMGPNFPARTTVQVARLWNDVKVEIEVVALIP